MQEMINYMNILILHPLYEKICGRFPAFMVPEEGNNKQSGYQIVVTNGETGTGEEKPESTDGCLSIPKSYRSHKILPI